MVFCHAHLRNATVKTSSIQSGTETVSQLFSIVQQTTQLMSIGFSKRVFLTTLSYQRL
jgi:hypothetical protein